METGAAYDPHKEEVTDPARPIIFDLTKLEEIAGKKLLELESFARPDRHLTETYQATL